MKFDDAQLEEYARELGLDVERFNRDRTSDALHVVLDTRNGEVKTLGINAIPAIYLGEEHFAGRVPLETLAGAVERALGHADPATGPAQSALPSWDELICPVETFDPVTTRTPLKPGDPAPAFTLPSIEGKEVSLVDYRNQKIVVLVFVPSAWTPVCSGQLPHYIENAARFEELGATMLIVTTDNVPTLWAWTRGMPGLCFPVLSDFWPHGAVAQKYGVLRPESGVSERALFVIDRDGTIRYINVHDINTEPPLDELFEAVTAAR